MSAADEDQANGYRMRTQRTMVAGDGRVAMLTTRVSMMREQAATTVRTASNPAARRLPPWTCPIARSRSCS